MGPAITALLLHNCTFSQIDNSDPQNSSAWCSVTLTIASCVQLFREYLMQNHFQEIHTPKLTAGSSEGGANVFSLQYFGRDCCLAQSPQLCKQMAVMSGFSRVFEIGPVFRWFLKILTPLPFSSVCCRKLQAFKQLSAPCIDGSVSIFCVHRMMRQKSQFPSIAPCFPILKSATFLECQNCLFSSIAQSA